MAMHVTLGLILLFTGLLSACESTRLYKEVSLDSSQAESNVCMSFSEDGSQCVSRTPDGTTTLYDFDSKTRNKFFLTHDSRSLCPSIMSGCKALLACPRNQKQIGIYTLQNKVLSTQFDMPAELLDVKFDHNSSKLYCACDNQNENEALICSYDIQTQQKIRDFNGVVYRTDYIEKINSEIILTDRYAPKLSVNSALGMVFYGDQPNTLTVWDMRSSKIINKIKFFKPWRGTTYSQFAVDQDIDSTTHKIAVGGKQSGQSGCVIMEYDLRATHNPIFVRQISEIKKLVVRYVRAGDGLVVGCGPTLAMISKDGLRMNSFNVNKNQGDITAVYQNDARNVLRTATSGNYCHEWNLKQLQTLSDASNLKEESMKEIEPLITDLQNMDAARAFQPDEWTDSNQAEYKELESKIQALMGEKNLM